MRITILIMLLFSAHFSLTAFAPGPKASVIWPFGVDSKSWLGILGSLPSQPGGLVTTILAGVAGIGFLAAALGLFWHGIPTAWWPVIVIVSALASVFIFVLFFGVAAIVPILLDLGLLWGTTSHRWAIEVLRGG